VRCAIYTRKSSEEGLEQSFNSLDAQREACEAYVLSQRHEGWKPLPARYDDGGFSGGNMERPALKRLLEDLAAKRLDTVVVYKVDRLTRSLADFAKIVEQFDGHSVSFVSVTQQFNTTSSMGRLTLNVLLSFAQFEREVTGERIRDKIAASKRKGMWMGGVVPMGYDLDGRRLVVNAVEGDRVRQIFESYLNVGCVSSLQTDLEQKGIRSKKRVSKTGQVSGGKPFGRGALYLMLQNRVYLGEITHKGESFPGQQPAIIDRELWDRVQKKLNSNIQGERKKTRPKAGSLLAGLLYGSDGSRYTPAHANKAGRRYLYYVANAIHTRKAQAIDGPKRLPAKEIEELVLQQIRILLESPQRLQEVLDRPPDPKELKSLVEAARRTVTKLDELVGSLLHRVIVRPDRVEIQIGKVQLLHALLQIDTEDSEQHFAEPILTVVVNAVLKRHGGEMRLQLPPDAQGSKPRPVPSVIRAIARANEWLERILAGKYANARAIAATTGFDERYVGRILPLAFLAPDLTEAIMDGSGNALLGDLPGNIPAHWPGQRALLANCGDVCVQ
jgi:site-specific DNA recombinase